MNQRSEQWLGALTASLFAASLYYIRFGYQFGFSDQDEFIPLVMKWLNPDLFVRDWFVNQQASEFGVRTIFAGVIGLFSFVMPIWTVVLTFHVATWLALTIALYNISYLLYNNKLTSFLFVIAATVLTARWNPGGNDVFHAMLVPSSTAWAFGFWSLDRFLRHRYTTAALLSCGALFVHPLVGIQIGALLGACLILEHPKKAVRFVLPLAIVTVPMVVVFSNLGAPSNLADGSDQILTHIRAPHHYLPASFSIISWIKFAAILLFGGLSFWFDTSRFSRGTTRTSILLLLGISLLVLGFSAVLIGPVEFGLVTRLQPFNIAVFVRILSLLGCISLAVYFLPNNTLRLLDLMVSSSKSLGFAIFFLVLSVMVGRHWYGLLLSNPAAQPAAVSVLDHETATWITQHTPQNALFAVPPSLSGFQIQTSRAQYVNFKAFPFTTVESEEWLRRLLLVAPVQTTSPGGTDLMHQMDRAYVASKPSYWVSTPELTDIDYILRPLPISDAWSESSPAWCSPVWCIYEPKMIDSFSN
mgnify:CR=1 FL=1